MFSFQPIADGAPGVETILRTLNALKDDYGRRPELRAAAMDILRAAGSPSDEAGQVSALAAFTRQAIVFVSDPLNLEYIQTPDRMILDIWANGNTFGDCDDHCLLFAALCEAIGVPCRIIGIATSGGLADHVVVVAQLEHGALEFDLVSK